MNERREFALTCAIFFTLLLVLVFFLVAQLFIAKNQLDNYKAKYEASLAWIADGIPSDEANVMEAIEEVIADNARRL